MIEIVPATKAHGRALLSTLREGDREEVMAAGLRPGRAVMISLRDSLWSNAAMVDGEVAALWGVGGTLLSGIGRPWLLTGTACNQVSPLKFARVYRSEVGRMLASFFRLENYVDSKYTGAVRMLRLAGFTINDPEPFGQRGALFHRFELVV